MLVRLRKTADYKSTKVHLTKLQADELRPVSWLSLIMLFLWLLTFCASASGFLNPYPKGQPCDIEGNVGNKLILTPYIESGQYEKAKSLALVPPLKENVTSYSGFLTVNKTCGSNMFFWFFPAEKNTPEAPVAVWLQGGPGASSLYGLFSEIGPYELTPKNQLNLRKYFWSHDASYIFIDNPVGTGYSYTENEECYAKDEVDVGRNLLSAVKQILKLFSEYSSNPFFVTGESYGGKYVPALSYAIHMDKDPEQKINLQGLAIGNGLVDPVNQLLYSSYLYQISLIDENEKNKIQKMENYCKNLITKEKWREAFYCFDSFFNGDLVSGPTYFQNVTGFQYYFNFLYAKGQPEGDLAAFVTQSEIRKSIHVGNAIWNRDKKVEIHLMEDVMKSVRPWLEELLEHYRVLIYNGQLDIIVAYPLTEGYLQKLKWSAAEKYKVAKRHIWTVDKELAGYAKTAGKLTDVLVRNAGHMVPMDQPKWAFDLINRFFRNKPFY